MSATFGSLFSGIGGLDLGLERAGWGCQWQVEIDEWCQRVLAAHWPDVPRFGDVKGLDDGDLAPVDLICGGFPCQPVSTAGKRLAQADERWLWPEFARVVRVLRPRLVLVENVPGLLVPYEFPKDSGAWWPAPIEEVLGDLAAGGYDAEWDCIPAAAVGAPHLRYRVFIVGHCRDGGAPAPVPDAERNGLRVERERRGEQRGQSWSPEPRDDGEAGTVADADGGRREVVGESESSGLEGASGGESHRRRADGGQPDASAVADTPRDGGFGGQPLRRPRERVVDGGAGGGGPQRQREDRAEALADPEVLAERAGLREGGPRGVGRGRSRDGGSTGDVPLPERVRSQRVFDLGPAPPAAFGDGAWWATEPDVGRVAHGVPARVDRLRGLGNAVAPQVAEWIGRRLLAADDLMDASEGQTSDGG